MNTVIIEGNLGKDAKVGFSTKGTAYAHFSVADTPKAKGDEKPPTIWWNCSAWKELAEKHMEGLTKGTRVKIEGWAIQENWLDKITGEKRSGLKINVQKLEIVERKPKEASIDF